MPDRCTFCEVSRIPTNHLILNDGEMWIEFCEACSHQHVLTNAEGEVWTIAQLWNKCSDASYVRSAEEIEAAQGIKDVEEAYDREAEAHDYEEGLSWEAEKAYWDEQARLAKESYEEQVQLRADAWENFIDRCLWSGKYTPPQYLPLVG